jgi:copper resistance protein C
MNRSCRLTLATLIPLIIAQVAWAHAFLDHAEPPVGSTVHSSPPAVKIWFTENLEPALCKLQVFDASGREVDKHNVTIGPGNAALLMVSLPPLEPAKYKVVWRVVAVDTHVTSGDFQFGVAP